MCDFRSFSDPVPDFHTLPGRISFSPLLFFSPLIYSAECDSGAARLTLQLLAHRLATGDYSLSQHYKSTLAGRVEGRVPEQSVFFAKLLLLARRCFVLHWIRERSLLRAPVSLDSWFVRDVSSSVGLFTRTDGRFPAKTP